MPLYDYLCKKCGNTFEKLRGISDSDSEIHCPKCASSEVERLLSTFSSAGCGPRSNSRFR